MYPRVLVGLGLAQLTLAAFVFIKAGYYPGICLMPLPVMVYRYGNRSYKRLVAEKWSDAGETLFLLF